MSRILVITSFFLLTALLLFGESLHASTAREQEIRGAVTAFVKEKTAGTGWDVRIRRITLPVALKLPDGPLEYEVVAPQQWEGWGVVNLSVYARQNGRVIGNFSSRVEVEALAEVVVTLRQIDNGAVISPGDIATVRRELTHNHNHFARKIDDVAGKKSRASIRANQPVRQDLLERVPLVKSGQSVTIVAENGSMKISVSGTARSSGAAGDLVRVQNSSSLKEISARIVNATTVQVAF